MKIVQTSDYLIYFDNVRVDPYIINWNTNLGLSPGEATGGVTMYKTEALFAWKAYLTQVRIFAKNIFTGSYAMVFEGEIANRGWTDQRSNSGTITFQIAGFFHWLEIPIPMMIGNRQALDAVQNFKYEANGINYNALAQLFQNKEEISMKNKNLAQIIDHLFQKMNQAYYSLSNSDSSFGWAKLQERFKVLVDINPDYRSGGFLDLFTLISSTQIESFYVYLNEVMTQMMLEFYQDRDGSFHIKNPSWADDVLLNHIIDESLVHNIQGNDNWNKEPTRTLAIGGIADIWQLAQQNSNQMDFFKSDAMPVGLYIGDGKRGQYYSSTMEIDRKKFGISGTLPGVSSSDLASDKWFDNLTGKYTISSPFTGGDARTDVAGNTAPHRGTDYRVPQGTILKNIGASGIVKSKLSDANGGNILVISQMIDRSPYEFKYMHLSEFLVNEGDSVIPGQPVAKSGGQKASIGAGNSTGPHLHLEIWDMYEDKPIDPNDFLKTMQTKIKAEVTAATSNFSTPEDDKGVYNAFSTTDGGKTNNFKPDVKSMVANTFNNPVLNGKVSAQSLMNAADAVTTNWIEFEATAYIATCEGCTGITATGLDVRDTSKDYHVVAVDPKIIPLHSTIEIQGTGGVSGTYYALDTGGAIKGNKIDILVSSYEAAIAFGRRKIKVRIVKRGKDGAASSTPPEKLRAVSYSGSNDLVYPLDERGNDYKNAIVWNAAAVDANLVCSMIDVMSGWRRKFESKANNSSGGYKGLMGVPIAYTQSIEAAEGAVDWFDGDQSVKYGCRFFQHCLDTLRQKPTLALAAYYLGDPVRIDSLALKTKAYDYVELTDEIKKVDPGAAQFVNDVLNIYLTTLKGDYIAGDPHKDFGKVYIGEGDYYNVIPSSNTATDGFTNKFGLELSEEERQFKMNLMISEQRLIRYDATALANASKAMVDEIIFKYAKYMMQMARAAAHGISINLMTCMPFLRVGFNTWVEPSRSNLVAYITGVTHQGVFGQGCFTSVRAEFIRTVSTYDDVETNLFMGTSNVTSADFGPVVKKEEMTAMRQKLIDMNESENEVVDDAHNITTLREIYTSPQTDPAEWDYVTQWNAEYTKDEIDSKINDIYTSAPAIIKKRVSELQGIITASEDFFLSKLLAEFSS